MKYYFSGDTLFTHTNMDTCYREYQTNLVVSYAGSDSTLWCPPSVDEEPIFDTLYYKCSDYPSAYVADCWNIDNPWINN